MEGILKVCDVKLTYNTKVKSWSSVFRMS